MAWNDLTNPEAWKLALANLLRKGEDVGTYISEAPEKAGKAIVEAGQRQSALMNKAFDPTGKTLIRDPQAANQAAMNLLEGPLGFMPAGITAWHGSLHTFEKFDMSKVGTGEGAQSYGHGMYFAEARPVAEQYQAALSNTKYLSGGKELKGNDAWAAQFLHDFQGDALPKKVDVNTAVAKANEILKETPTKQEIVNKIKELDKAGVNVENGSLYKVDIPDEHIPMMLDWDKPFAQQPKYVQDAIKNSEWDAKGIVGYWMDKSKENPSYTGSDLYQRLTSTLGSDKAASDYLNSIGIKGISYLDQGSRTSKVTSTPINQLDARIEILKKDIESGLGNQEVMKQKLKNLEAERAKSTNLTSNFVVFDPKDVKIL